MRQGGWWNAMPTRARRPRAAAPTPGRPTTFSELGHYSIGLHSPKTGRTFRPATPPLFSFNSPLGACPKCRGFGRVIEIDYRLAMPDHSLSIDGGACFVQVTGPDHNSMDNDPGVQAATLAAIDGGCPGTFVP